MHTFELSLGKALSSVDITLAWAVLWKDYIASTDISFFLTEASSCTSPVGEARVIGLHLDEKQTLQELHRHVHDQLLHGKREHDPAAAPSIQAHLYISPESCGGPAASGSPACEEESAHKSWRVGDTRIDLNVDVSLRDRGARVQVSITPNELGEISSHQAERLIHQLQHVFSQVLHATSAKKLVYDISTASQEDYRDVWAWNRDCPAPVNSTAIDIFSEHVRRDPSALAVDAWDGSFTYAKLDALSSLLALRLAQGGVRNGIIVPLCFEKTRWALVAILAVLKAGAAFVLLDEALPQTRLQQLADIIAQEKGVILTSLAQHHRAKPLAPTCIVVDSGLLDMQAPTFDATDTWPKPDDLAYIVFTSGTTGIPKAAMARHYNICSFATFIAPADAVSHTSRILLLASYAFDMSIGNIFLSLLTGACLCMPSSWECKNNLSQIVDDYRATFVHATPSVSKMIDPSKAASLQVLELSGEPCNEDALYRWRTTPVRVMNTCGHAECSVTSVVNEDILSSAKPSIIGKGLGCCWIMDQFDTTRLAPIGGVGVLIVEGPLVGPGYFQNANGTQSKFFDNPEWLLHGWPEVSKGRRGRIYNTGDLVRYKDQGEIEYIGRRDLQVKIRGQRVELEELAANVQAWIPESVQWTPEVVKIQNGAELLVIFLVPATDLSNVDEILRSIVDVVDQETRKNLPPAMIPGAYIRVSSIPLTLSGKTDHRRLKEIAQSMPLGDLMFARKPSIASLNDLHFAKGVPSHLGSKSEKSSSSSTDAEYNSKADESGSTSRSEITEDSSLASPVEQFNGLQTEMRVGGCESQDSGRKRKENTPESIQLKLKLAWSETFEVAQSSINESDSFFDYGGQSLLAIKLVGQAARNGVEVDVATIFQYPKFTDMASHCRLILSANKSSLDRFALLPDVLLLKELAELCGLSESDIEDAYPCTPMQEGLITAIGARAPSYTGRGVLKLPAGIDPERLSRAWQQLVSVNTILRTRIVDCDSHGLLQVVIRPGPEKMTPLKKDLKTYLGEDDRSKMGLGTRLCRGVVLCTQTDSYFVLTMHHATYDGWTLPRLGMDLFRAYHGVRIRPDVGFNTFIQHVKGLPRSSAEAFWAQQLSNIEETSIFPQLPSSVQRPRADSVRMKTFDPLVVDARGISVPSILRAAWALLVSKFSANSDVTFGTILSGRNVPIIGVDDMRSPTITSVPVRVRLCANETTESFVSRIQKESLDAIPFENIGLQNIRKISSTTRAACNFQTLLVIHPPQSTTLSLSHEFGPAERDLKASLESLDISTSLSNFNEYSLMILISPQKDKFVIEASFDSKVLEEARVEMILDQYMYVARQIGSRQHLHQLIESIDVTCPKDLELIWQWNSQTFESQQLCIHDIVAKTINAQGSATAIHAFDGDVTYQELDKYASRLAILLQKRGIGKGNLVPICMEKSKWATVAMLGILRAGAGFVAIDVRQQPVERIRNICNEVNADLVLTTVTSTPLAHKITKNVIVCEEFLEDQNSVNTGKPMFQAVSPADPAFVVFTSGSTGTPKGIIITHSNFCSLLSYHEEKLLLSRTSRIYDYASYSFDIAVHNALMAIALGGCLCVPSEADRDNDVEGSLERLRANWADLTPSVARLIDPLTVPDLKTLVLSGEAVGKDLIDQWSGHVEVINGYGPAECQICTIQNSLQDQANPSQIGRGVACSTWVVDPQTSTLSPIGAVGELHIEGPIISPGYLNAASEAFLPDPKWLLAGSSKMPGRSGIVYRTGDLVSYLPDGQLLYVGRSSTQTKINGQRVELGEIEYQVRRNVSSALDVVVDVIVLDGITQVAAYIHKGPSTGPHQSTASKGADVSVELLPPPPGLEDSLKALLPSFMIPSIYFCISKVPLTPTGKINRRRLKESILSFSRDQIVSVNHQQQESDDAELTERQEKMIQIWSLVLNLESSQINIRSDFFQSGGDSIAAMRLVKIARKRGLSFTVAEVFRNSQLRQLCDVATECVKHESPEHNRDDLVPPFGLVSMDEREALIYSGAKACGVTSDDIVDIYPCTPFQEGVFAQTANNSSAYIQHTMLKFSTTLNLARILAAWESAIYSNPILRTRIFQSENGDLMQLVIREAPQWHRYSSSEEYMSEAGGTTMSLGSSLSRLALLRSGGSPESSGDCTIIWSIHHALYDAWTIGLILREVSDYYHGRKSVDPCPDFSAYVKFLRDNRAESEVWWRSRLVGASNASLFPKVPMTNQAASPICTRRRTLHLPSKIPAGYTMPVLLRSAWAILMHRYSTGDHILFGEVRLGRNVPISNVDAMRGPTIASVPMLLPVNGDQTVYALLDMIRETDIQMQGHDHLGLQNIAKLDVDAKAACGFQTLLVFRENEDQTIEKDSIFTYDDSIDDIRNFHSWNFMVIFHHNSTGLVAETVFRESLIPTKRVDLLLQQTESVFKAVCELPLDTLVREFDMPVAEDLEKIWQWNKSAPTTVNKFMHDLVSEQAQRTPDKIAVLAHDGQMTYRILDEVSTAFAAQLQSRGVGPGWYIPLCFEKSLWVPVAMLAVIKTGAAFSVMDVSYPESRLEIIVNLLNARLILSSHSQLDLARRLCGDVFTVDHNSSVSENAIDTAQWSQPNLQDTNQLMYVCFTSGSTGIPKGVMVSHRNLASAGLAQTRDLEFVQEDRIYDFSSHAFDANIWHTWWALIIGATLCIPSHEDRMDNLAGSIDAFNATALFLTPSVARTLDPTEVPRVKRLYLGGEAVTPLDVSMWHDHLDLWCAYGPTETTPLCIFTRLYSPEAASNIGRGSGVNPWICNPDNYNELVAVGAVGEMLMEGPLVTLGYYQQPEKTSAVFVTDPEFLLHGTRNQPGRHGRLYRSGDLVRYCYDGTVEYVGRADTQVKLRGQRVEFGEVEYHLKNALPVFTTVCEIITHNAGRPMLVTFCASLSTSDAPDQAAARRYLAKRLPPYMIPEAFLQIDEIPRNPSGKINRQRLRELGPELLHLSNAGDQESRCELNRTLSEAERVLLQLWATALGQDNLPPDPESDFFEAGADSIAAMKLSNLARKKDLQLSMKDIISSSKLEAMVMKCRPMDRHYDNPLPFSLIDAQNLSHIKQEAATTCRIDVEAISDIYPCTPLQTELFALTMRQSQAYIRRCVFDVPHNLDCHKLIKAWNTVIGMNATLRTSFVETEAMGLLQVVAKSQVELAEGFDTYLAKDRPNFDFGVPLSRVVAFPNEQPPKIFWTIHHALYDGWSIQLLEEQLRNAYNDKHIAEPPFFSGFVRKLVEQNENASKEFWMNRLSGCASTLIYPSLPLGYQAQPCKTLNRTLNTRISSGMNLQSTIHAAWALLVAQMLDCDDVVFAATLTGREPWIPGVEHIVGPTITPVPIRVRVRHDQSVHELINCIEQETSNMALYQHVGMKNIERINSDTRAASKLQTLIVVTPNDGDNSSLTDIRCSSYDIEDEHQSIFHTFGLVLFFTPSGKGIDLEIVFDPVVLAEREAQRLGGRLESIITKLDACREQYSRVRDIECLGAEDLEDIWSWNAALPSTSDRLLHEVILEKAKEQLGKIAIDAWDVQIDYTQLQELSQALEVQLRSFGITKGCIVPLLAQKSGYTAVAALAILRSGATILPLDATQPYDRLRTITDQVCPSVILVSQACTHKAIGLATHVLAIEQCRETIEIASTPPSSTVSYATVDDVACILFTSGSTGIPKGVQQTHSALVSAIHYQAEDSGFNDLTRAFDFASYSFDVSWNMIFKTLATGGTLCVPSEDERQNELIGALNRSRATLTELTASVARLIDPNLLPSLDTLIMSGESVDLREFQHWTPRIRLIVCYGPSECTSVTTMTVGSNNGSTENGIGKASACVTWLVDQRNPRRLVPVGAVGEILIEGPIVGKGYYKNELLTKQSYTKDLPWLKSRDRAKTTVAFKSGDLAHYDHNGNLHFVSRKDTQVKLYGQRIELDEVQHHIRAAMGSVVSSVICCVLEQGSCGQRQLVAFLTQRKGLSSIECRLTKPDDMALTTLRTLDGKLRSRLPKYMIPAAYYFVTTIPRTRNGKIDRAQLLAAARDASPDDVHRGRPGSDATFQCSFTAAEDEMRRLWSAALEIPIESIGPNDHFFNLNGDSIAAMKLVANARNKGHTLRVSDVFMKPVLSELALAITCEQSKEQPAVESRAFDLTRSDRDETSIRMDAADLCGISDASIIEDIYPCTPLQENMLAATIKDPGSFVSLRPYRVPSHIDLRRLRAAWATVISRNRILRTRLIDLKDGGLHQAVLAGGSEWYTYASMSAFIKSLKQEEMSLGTHLTSWSVIENGQERWLVWKLHHAIYDGWSLQIVEDEVSKAYFGELLPAPGPDMRPMIRYLSEQRRESSCDFWRDELRNAEGSFSFPQVPVEDYQAVPRAFLERTIAADLTHLPTGISLNSLIYGSWALEVTSISGNQCVCFGTIVTGRYAPIGNIDKLVGPTITTVPVVVEVDDTITLTEYLGKLQDLSVRRIPHEHLGVSQIRQISSASKAACRFQTVLVIQPPSFAETSKQTAESSVMDLADETSIDGFPDQHAVLNQYGLMIEILPFVGSTAVRASYDDTLLSEKQVNRIISRLEHTMNRIVQSGYTELSTPLGSFRTLSSHDLGEIWSSNALVPARTNLLVHEMIYNVSRQQPEALAIDACDGSFTYQELDTISSNLSEELITLGIRPGQFVPLIFRKSKWANVSMLAVMKAGAAFVPLDADHPEGRLRAIMQPLNAGVILCSASTRDRAARLARNAFMVDDTQVYHNSYSSMTEHASSKTLQVRRGILGTDLAYVVFTSGSTGTPKGVKISHSNLATAIASHIGTHGYNIESSTRVLDSSSYSFDACVCNFFYAVTSGGCLCIPDDEALKGDLGSFMRDFKIDFAQLVPSVARTLDPVNLPDLKRLVLTGEALTRGDIVTWSKKVHLLNVYGPTECTIFCAISPRISNLNQAGVIGQGYGANIWLTEIGNPQKLVPAGSVGEILIEGPLIGEGYLGPYAWPVVVDPPWLTAGTESHTGRSGTLFRTGDQAYLNETGSLVLLGRIGSEIKLRGQRVDLAEIEDVARTNDPVGLEIVADIASVSWGEGGQERQILLLFVAPKRGTDNQLVIVEDKIRNWVPHFKRTLNETLPSYLQPEAILLLQQLPKTSSAKVDRRHLKEVGSRIQPKQVIWISSNTQVKSCTSPSTAAEQQLADLWANVLGIDKASITQEDDFFQLGGTSLGVMRLTTRAAERGIALKNRDVFQYSKLSELATLLGESSGIPQAIAYEPFSLVADIDDSKAFISEYVTPSLGVTIGEVEDILPANGFQVDYMHNEEEPLGLQYAYLDISRNISWPKLVQACESVVQSLQCLRSRFIYHEGKYYQIIMRNAPMLQQEVTTDEQITTFSNRFCAQDCRAAAITDIYTKVTIVDAGASKRRVIFRTSHTQYDGWCINRMLLAIARVYNGGEVGPVPEWTRLLCHREQQSESSRTYWRSLLSGTTAMTPSLVHKPGGTMVRTLRTFALPNFHDANDNRRTRPTVVINVAWALLLEKLAGHDEVVFGNVTTGRNGDMPGLDSVMGPCVNMLPMRLRPGSKKATRDRKKQLRELLEASAKQVDERASFEGLDWDDMVQQCTNWPSGMRYTSAVHFRNMAFEPELTLDGERVVVVWYELVATPHWTTVLVYPEEGVLRVWLLADPAEIGDEGGDEILNMLAGLVDEILEAIKDDIC